MSIKLGDAILYLKTDNSNLDKGLRGADTKARGWASGFKGFIGNTLSYAAGGILTNVVQSFGRIAGSMAKEALGELADYERLGMSLQTLSQREILRMGQTGQGLAGYFEKSIGLTSEQSARLVQLRGEYADLQQTMSNYEDVPMRLQEKWADMTTEIYSLVDATGQGNDALWNMATGTINMADATELVGTKAQDLVKWIELLAIKSPFDQKGVADAFRTAMAYGFTTEQAQRLTEATIDFAAGSGASVDSMGRLSLALGQMHAKGKLTGEELRQMTEAGVPALDMLATHYGKTTAEIQTMISKGLVPADEAFEAIVGTMENEFAGAALAQSTSWAGLTNTFEDLKAIGLRELFTGIADAIQPFVIAFADWLEGDGMDKIREWGASIGQFAANVITFAQNLKPQIDFIKELFGLFFSGSTVDSAKLSLALEALGVPDWVIQSIRDLQQGFNNIREFWEGEGGQAIQGAAQERLQLLWDFLSGLAQQVIPWLVEQFEKISLWFNENSELIAAFVERAQEVFRFLMMVVSGVWEVIQPLLSGIIDAILGIVEAIMQAATGDWAAAWETIKEVGANALDAIEEFLLNFINWVLGWVGSDFEKFKEDWRLAWDAVKNVFEIILGKITEKFTTWIDTVKTWGKDIIEGIVKGLEDNKDKILGFFQNLWAGIQNFWNSLWDSNSPSGVTEQWGSFLGQGIVIGLDKQKQAILDTIGGLTNDMKLALTGNVNPDAQQRIYNFYGINNNQEGNIMQQLADAEFLYG